MSLPLKADRIQANNSMKSNEFDPENSLMLNGFSSAKQQVTEKHPLEALERTHFERLDQMNFAMLKRTQGIHAPLRILAERRAAQQVGRLPFLASSNLMLDVITGRDESIGLEDVLNDVTQPEMMGPPHMVVERHLGLL